MKNHYFTFGQAHRHVIKSVVYDKDCVVAIKAKDAGLAREKMFKLFGAKWSMQYDELPEMIYFPRGVFKI